MSTCRQEPQMSTVAPETMVTMLNKILDELQTPENLRKIEEARDIVGNEMLMMMQHLFPIIVQVQKDVIKEYGFSEGREGIVNFAKLLRRMEREDAEIARLHNLIKANYLPPVAVNTSTDALPNDRINSC